jgi:hypothetical protein
VPTLAVGQRVRPVGVVPLRSIDGPVLRLASSGVRRVRAPDSIHHHPRRWVAVGALAGRAMEGIFAAAVVRPPDDAPVGRPVIVAVCAAAGAAAGALVGGLAYLVSH